MKNLVIVESPTKARTIGKFLGEDYEIKASMGHVMDLPKSTLGVDVEHDFAPQFELVAGKEKIVSELKSAAKTAGSIILATDPDREGEAIAYHVREILPMSNTTNKQIKRIVFHEITKEAIEEALVHPRLIDINLVDAQTARRVLDRLVGYRLSPLLWQKVRRGLSAGRVQSVALRLIVEREREIEKFKKEEYWTIMALLRQVQSSELRVQSEGTEFELIEINGEKIEVQETFQLYDGEYRVTKTTIGNQKSADEIALDLKTKKFVVSDVLQKETRRSPQPPYTTSTLQQDAAHRFGFSGKRTMSLAQKLYEEGFITYHRTDSVTVSNASLFKTRDFIKKEYGEKFLPEKPRFYKTKQKLAQEAHEGIRPTNANTQHLTINKQLGRDVSKLYELIWKRAVASQMADAIIESTTVIVDVTRGPAAPSSNPTSSKKSSALPAGFSAGAVLDTSGRATPPASATPRSKEDFYKLKANGSVLVFEGFLKVNPQALEDKKLPEFRVSESLKLLNINIDRHETPPPPRYNDASIIKTLEEKGIGRPSTYATIVSTIESRQYVEKIDPTTGLGRGFAPTSVGVAVNDFLVANFSDIDDIPFTAEMEDQLDQIAHGEKEWVPMIRTFYGPFEKKLESVKEDAGRVKIEVEQISETCPTCGSPLVIRLGRFGKFISCSTFPACKFSKPFVEETNFTCPKDKGKIIIKKTRRGRRFYGCSNYPACTFAAWKLEDIKKQQ